jgi:hypothetical protein
MSTRQLPVDEALAMIMGLRRGERLSDSSARDEIASVRESLEDLVGQTVRPATAARLLRVSRPAIKRWLDRGEISTVLTPEGRREIPLTELLPLLDAVGEQQSRRRPLAAVIRERARRAEQIDIDRLLPRRHPRTHRTAELQSLAYHRLVAERLNERMLDDARRRLARWRSAGHIDPRWAKEWDRILTRTPPRVAKAIAANTPRARELRQTSPFAGVLSEPERRRLFDLVEQRAAK